MSGWKVWLAVLMAATLLAGCAHDLRAKVSVQVTEVQGLLTRTYDISVSNRNDKAVVCTVTLQWQKDGRTDRKSVDVSVPAMGVAKSRIDTGLSLGGGETPAVQLEACKG